VGTYTPPPNSPLHRVEISERPIYRHEYTSEISPAFFDLPRHVRRLTGSIPDFISPHIYQEGELMDIIFITDSSVLFGVGCHGWILATRDTHILLRGGGPYDGPTTYLMSSFRSELGGIMAGLAGLGTLFRSRHINTCSVKFLWDNESSVLAAK
jgi:hypothetical protein